MTPIAQGYTSCRFRTPILPYTNIRGAASLDWTKRPGNYAEVRGAKAYATGV